MRVIVVLLVGRRKVPFEIFLTLEDTVHLEKNHCLI